MRKHLSREFNNLEMPCPNIVDLYISDELPDTAELLTAAHGFIFDGQLLLMVNVKGRGWTLPGGHREENENIVEALRREVLEEAGAIISAPVPVAYIREEIVGECPIHYRYPYPIAYQVFFIAHVSELRDIDDPDFESSERRFFPISSDSDIPWIRENRIFCKEVMSKSLPLLRDV